MVRYLLFKIELEKMIKFILDSLRSRDSLKRYLRTLCQHQFVQSWILLLVEKIFSLGFQDVVLEVSESLLRNNTGPNVPRLLNWYERFARDKKVYDEAEYKRLLSLCRVYDSSKFRKKATLLKNQLATNKTSEATKFVPQKEETPQDAVEYIINLIGAGNATKHDLLKGIECSVRLGNSDKVVNIYNALASIDPGQASKFNALVTPYFLKHNHSAHPNRKYKISSSNVWGNTILDFPVNRIAKNVS